MSSQKVAAIAASLLVFCSIGLSTVFESPPAADYYSSFQWRNRVIFHLPSDQTLSLSEDTELVVDEVLLEGTLVTNGHNLRIDTKSLSFGERGKIQAFASAAEPGPIGAGGEPGTHARAADFSIFFLNGLILNGSILSGTVTKEVVAQQGGEGKTGGRGEDGNQKPGVISVFAAKVVGVPRIDGTGQMGGKGGLGGTGGKGGTGMPGRDANARCIGSGQGSTPGERGATGGLGGQGGEGGKAGRPVPVFFSHGMQEAEVDLRAIVSVAGEPGSKGDPGDPGESGDGGPGGQGDTDRCGFWPFRWTARKSGSGPGPRGPQQTRHLGPGKDGALSESVSWPESFSAQVLPEKWDDLNGLSRPSELGGVEVLPTANRGIAVFTFAGLEVSRQKLIEPWLQFHWARTFALLVFESLIEAEEINRDLFDIQAEPDSVFAQVLATASQSRAAHLTEVWRNQFIIPLEGMSTKEPYGLGENSLQVASLVIQILEKVARGEELADQADTLVEALSQIQSLSLGQVQGTLANALDSCSTYLETQDSSWRGVFAMTTHYSVPVCLGLPDFRKKENLTAAIHLFPQSQNLNVPYLLEDFKRIQARRPTSSHHRVVFALSQLLLPQAKANIFDAERDSYDSINVLDFNSYHPGQDWTRNGTGVFIGFPELSSKKTTGEVARDLRSLSMLLQNWGSQ